VGNGDAHLRKGGSVCVVKGGSAKLWGGGSKVTRGSARESSAVVESTLVEARPKRYPPLMAQQPTPTTESNAAGIPPLAGSAPILCVFGLVCFGGVFYVARVAHSPFRPYVTLFMGASVQLLSGAVFVALRRRWPPIFHDKAKRPRVPYRTYGRLFSWFLTLWVVSAFYLGFMDTRPYVASTLLLACATLSFLQAGILLVTERSFHWNALLLLAARRLPLNLPSGAWGTATGAIDTDPKTTVLKRITRYSLISEIRGIYNSSTGQTQSEHISIRASVIEDVKPKLPLGTPGGPLEIEVAGSLWSAGNRVFDLPESPEIDAEIREEARGGDPLIALGRVNRESPQGNPRLVRDANQPVVIFCAPAGSNPRVLLWRLYAWSLLRVVGMAACSCLALGAAWWNPAFDHFEGLVRVTSARGAPEIKAGDTCSLRILSDVSVSGDRRCQATLTCGGRVYYGIRNYLFFECDVTRDGAPLVNGEDTAPTWSGGDPGFAINSGLEGSTVRLWDEATATSDITLDVRGRLEDLREF